MDGDDVLILAVGIIQGEVIPTATGSRRLRRAENMYLGLSSGGLGPRLQDEASDFPQGII